jgi:hypothetical protein
MSRECVITGDEVRDVTEARSQGQGGYCKDSGFYSNDDALEF